MKTKYESPYDQKKIYQHAIYVVITQTKYKQFRNLKVVELGSGVGGGSYTIPFHRSYLRH